MRRVAQWLSSDDRSKMPHLMADQQEIVEVAAKHEKAAFGSIPTSPRHPVIKGRRGI